MVAITDSFTAPSALVARLQVLGDGNRLRILEALRDGERCVCRLTASLEMGQPLLSHHLKVLREAGLISGRKEGRWVHYSIIPEALEELENFLNEIRQDAMIAGASHDQC